MGRLTQTTIWYQSKKIRAKVSCLISRCLLPCLPITLSLLSEESSQLFLVAIDLAWLWYLMFALLYHSFSRFRHRSQTFPRAGHGRRNTIWTVRGDGVRQPWVGDVSEDHLIFHWGKMAICMNHFVTKCFEKEYVLFFICHFQYQVKKWQVTMPLHLMPILTTTSSAPRREKPDVERKMRKAHKKLVSDCLTGQNPDPNSYLGPQ